MKRIVFRMEVNIYDGIIYCPYNHVASFLTTEYLTILIVDHGPTLRINIIRAKGCSTNNLRDIVQFRWDSSRTCSRHQGGWLNFERTGINLTENDTGIVQSVWVGSA